MNDEINLPENEMISAQTMKYLLDRESARHERTVKRRVVIRRIKKRPKNV